MLKVSLSIIFFLLLDLNSAFAIPAKEVQPIPERKYSETVHDLVNSAQHSIRVILFTIRYYPRASSSTVNYLVDDLASAAQRGLSVEVILEDSSAHAKDNAEENRRAGERLEKAGVKVYYDSPTTTTHVKLLIIDNRYVVIGSTNWSYYAFEKNHEASVLVDSSELAEYYSRYFESLVTE